MINLNSILPMATLLFSVLTSVVLFFAFARASVTKHDLQSSLTLPLMSVFNSQLQRSTRLSWSDTILQMQSSDMARLSYLSSLASINNIPIASGKKYTNNPSYIVQVKIGTPPQTLFMAIDTTQGTALVPCADCTSCSNKALAHAYYNQSKSKTYKRVLCSEPLCLKAVAPTPANQMCRPNKSSSNCAFRTRYSVSSIKAKLVQDNISLATDSIANYTFGCISDVTGSSFPAQGMLGLGRHPLSLLSQTSHLYKSTFSYCLPSYKSTKFSGSLKLGPNNQPNNIKSAAPLHVNARSNLYYVNLRGIMVDNKVLYKITPYKKFEYKGDHGIPTVFDSGTVYSVLVNSAYAALRNEIRSKMSKLQAEMFTLGGFDTCYPIKIDVTTITLMFPGMNMTLPQDNFLIQSTYGNTSCLAMSAAPATRFAFGSNVIGTYQQQNYRVLLDPPNSKLAVAPERCS